MDEKPALLAPRHPPLHAFRRGQLNGFIWGIVLGAAAWIVSQSIKYPPPKKDLAARGPEPSNFSWSQITPTTDLRFHPCYENFECARLDVPLDWHNATDNPQRVAIAVTRLRAAVPPTDASYGGPIVLNPGGPGGSGVYFALLKGEDLRTIVDSPGERHFDVIGFDPRGVNHSTPGVSCFPGDWERQNFRFEERGEGMPHPGSGANASLARVSARSKALADSCKERLEAGEAFGRHFGTPAVVEDMMALVEAFGELHEKDVSKEVEQWTNRTESNDMIEKSRWRKGKEKLQYWGISYGTLLGATFAAMHPERVERLVLDGVLLGETYYYGNHTSMLIDADKVLDDFFASCYEAGPEKCAAYAPEGPDGVKALYENVLWNLTESSVSVPAHGSFAPDVATYTDFMLAVRDAVYSPYVNFQLLARIIADLSAGNGTILAENKQQSRRVICPSSSCRRGGPWTEPCHDVKSESEIRYAIMCTDRVGKPWASYDESWQFWQDTRNQSKALGDWWVSVNAPCRHWSVTPAWRFDHPIQGNTSHPILWIGNTNDPVTPLRSAQESAENFPGSVVLHQKCDGHSSFAAPSTCTAKYIRRYFLSGKLPEPGTSCDVDQIPFEHREDMPAARFADHLDHKLFLALHSLAQGPVTSLIFRGPE